METRHAVWIGSKLLGNELQRNVTAEPGVRRTVDFPHPAGSEQRADLIRAKMNSGREWHREREVYLMITQRSKRRCMIRPRSFVDASNGGNAVEPGIETHNAFDAMTFHYGNVYRVTGGQPTFTKHQ